MTASKIVASAASGAGGGAGLDVDEVFSTFLYEGNHSAQNINNGINLGNNIAGSVDFDGSGDSLESSSHSFAYGTGDFTVEFWVYFDGISGTQNIFDNRSSSSTGFMIGKNNDTKIRFYWNGADRIVDSATISTGQWYHIAVARSSGTTKMFKNGTQIGSDYSDTNDYTSSVLEIGQRSTGDGLEFDGKLSNVRVVLGTAVYTSNFTTPTEPLTAISGTELLICTSNNLEDEGPNNISFTVKGDPQVLSSSPFSGNTGEGGLVWLKRRDGAGSHAIFDTVRGRAYNIQPSGTDPQDTFSSTTGLTSFNSNGFSLGSPNYGSTNTNNADYVSWTFRNSPMSQVVTWSGNGVAGRQISHSLGSVPGLILVKKTSGANSWLVYHRSLGNSKYLRLNTTDESFADSGANWNSTTPTSTVFTLGSDGNVNDSDGSTYVAYLFSHHANDGSQTGFGSDGDSPVISCGSYSGNGSATGPVVNLGFEPQWLMVKCSSHSGSGFVIMDNMRGFTVDGAIQRLETYNSNGDAARTYIGPTSTGFQPKTTDVTVNGSGKTYIYLAVRRGSLFPPEAGDATKVFHVNKFTSTGFTEYTGVGFAPDLAIQKAPSSGDNWDVVDKLRGPSKFIKTNSTDAEGTDTQYELGGFLNNGVKMGTSTSGQFNAWNPNLHLYWKRAPSYFDVCCYSGTGSARTVSHNLGAVPEMMWVKARSASGEMWFVYHKDLNVNGDNAPETDYLWLNGTHAAADDADAWNDTAPTASVFSVKSGGGTNNSGTTYIAYLFATVAGVSKVGSYTGNGASTQTIGCGFSSGARFVLLKRTDASDEWYVFDSVRGIVSGNDPFLNINNTQAEVTNQDLIEPHSSGFIINNWANGSGSSWIFYAIA